MDKIDKLIAIVSECLEDQNISYGLSVALKKVPKETELHKNHKEGAEKLEQGQHKASKKLQIGGGKYYLPEFINIDIFPPADIIFDIREGLPLEAASFEFIFSEHFLEHIDYPVSVNKFLSECYRVLKPGGQLVIGVPDSEAAIMAYTNNDTNYFTETADRWQKKRGCTLNTYLDLLNYHFRDQYNDDKYTPHFWSYNFDNLSFLLKQNGFQSISNWDVDSTIVNPKRINRTLYITAKK
ncbi:MAG: class I SAM-dependent methyltransferase [Lutisporaceae bacterium]